MPNYSIPTLIDHGAALLRDYVKADNKRTDTLRSLATIVVGIRRKTKTEDGQPDWAGRTAKYREAMAQMYEAAGIPPDSAGNVQAALRYHIGNVLREHVATADLEQAGLKAEGPRDRQQARQAGSGAGRTAAEPGSLLEAIAQASTLLSQAADLQPTEEDRPQATILLLTMEAMLHRIREALLSEPGPKTAEPEPEPARPRARRAPAKAKQQERVAA